MDRITGYPLRSFDLIDLVDTLLDLSPPSFLATTKRCEAPHPFCHPREGFPREQTVGAGLVRRGPVRRQPQRTRKRDEAEVGPTHVFHVDHPPQHLPYQPSEPPLRRRQRSSGEELHKICHVVEALERDPHWFLRPRLVKPSEKAGENGRVHASFIVFSQSIPLVFNNCTDGSHSASEGEEMSKSRKWISHVRRRLPSPSKNELPSCRIFIASTLHRTSPCRLPHIRSSPGLQEFRQLLPPGCPPTLVAPPPSLFFSPQRKPPGNGRSPSFGETLRTPPRQSPSPLHALSL